MSSAGRGWGVGSALPVRTGCRRPLLSTVRVCHGAPRHPMLPVIPQAHIPVKSPVSANSGSDTSNVSAGQPGLRACRDPRPATAAVPGAGVRRNGVSGGRRPGCPRGRSRGTAGRTAVALPTAGGASVVRLSSGLPAVSARTGRVVGTAPAIAGRWDVPLCGGTRRGRGGGSCPRRHGAVRGGEAPAAHLGAESIRPPIAVFRKTSAPSKGCGAAGGGTQRRCPPGPPGGNGRWIGGLREGGRYAGERRGERAAGPGGRAGEALAVACRSRSPRR